MPDDLPAGTVTLLFTDIEGSTRLLHELGPERYRDALAEHRRLLRDVFQRHDGYEVDYEGDAFFVAFQDAAAAVAAAGEAQAALAEGPVRVRMGLHTGEPLLDPPKYVGVDVHKAARIMSAGHGGQVLLSAATRQLAAADACDLGEHRLKDFDAPVSLFQLGDERFPPLRTVSNTNLPRPASSFVGREREIVEVVALVRDGARLVTLTGPGGSGKTRLAIEAAAELIGEFKAGVFWVGLASLRDSALVMETIAQTLGAKEELTAHIGERELLLLLDNFEQVVDAAPGLSELVAACPSLHLLVTSRELLRVQGEVEYPVLPLAEPEAVELFCARSLLEADQTIAELCRRLDELPLPVELAAARTSVLAPAQILERISQRLDLLKGGRDADPRQQTLRATIEWSYDLLTPHEQQLFARLAVFAGGCTLDAAEQVAEADLDTLQSLLDKSLLRHTEERYWMLETIRQFALERLTVSSDADHLNRRYAEWFAALAAPLAWPMRFYDSDATAVIDVELANLRSGLAFALERDDAVTAGDLVFVLWFYWLSNGLGREAALCAKQYLGLELERLTPLERFPGLIGASEILLYTGQPDRAVALTRELVDTGMAHADADIHGLPAGRLAAAALSSLSRIELNAGAFDRARADAEKALELRRERGEPFGIAHALAHLAAVALAERDFAKARELFVESRAASELTEERTDVATTKTAIAECELLLGDPAAAAELLQSSLNEAREVRDRAAPLAALRVAGMLAVAREKDAAAAALFGAVQKGVEEGGVTVFDRYDVERHEEFLQRARKILGADAFQEAVERGHELTDEDALNLAARIAARGID